MPKKPVATREPTLDDLIAGGYRYMPLDTGAPPEAPPEKSGLVRRALGDTGVALAKGVIGVPEALVGMADLVSGGQAGKLAEEAGFRPKEAKAILDEYLSPEQQAANQAVQQAEGFVGKGVAALTHPSTIWQSAVESAPSMLGGGVVARGVLGGGAAIAGPAGPLRPGILARMVGSDAAPIIAAGIGEGAVTAGQNAEQVRQEDPTGTLTGQQSAILAGSGALTGGIGIVAGKIAKSWGIGDVDTLLAGVTKASPQVQKGFVRRVLEGALTEGVLEELPQSVQEQVAQNMALGKPLDDGVDHAAVMGMLAGGLMGAIAGPMVSGTPEGNAIRDERLPEAGPLTKALNVATEQRAQQADAGKSITPDQATVSAKARIDELGKKEAGTPDEELPGPNGEPVTVSGTPPQILSAGETQEKQFLEANKDNPAVLAGAKGKVVSPIPGAIDADVALERMRDQLRTDEAIVKAREREADAAHAATLQPQPEPESDAAPAPEPTDILSPSGGPWKAKLAAQKALKSRPDKADLALASVAGGYVLRRKPDAQQPDVHESPPVAAVADAGGSDQPAGGGGPVGPVAADATGGSAPAAAAPAPSSGEAELLADGGAAPDGAVRGEPIDAEWRAFTPESGLVDEAKQFPSAEQAEGATDAQAVRSDEGQVRSGEPSQGTATEGSLRPSAEQGRGDLQQPAPDQTGEHGRQAEVAPTEATRSSEQAKEAAATEAKPERAADNREDAGSTVPAGSPESAQSRSDATLQTVMGMTDEQRRAAIDAESMETRHDAPQVAQPTKGKRVRVIARTLNGIKQVTANLYELPNYNGPQLAVSEYKSSRGHGYRVYLPKSGAFITDSNGVSSLDDTLKLAVLRIHNARQTIASRAPAAEREQSLKTSAEKARWTRAPAADRLGILGRAGWTVNPPSKATERMQRISWDKMSDSQRQRISAAMEASAAPQAAPTKTEQTHGSNEGQEGQGRRQEGLLNAQAVVHQDPGQPAEAATKPVVADALKTAAKREDRPLAEMKADLLAQIDAAIAKAPSTEDIDADIGIGEAKTRNGKREFGGGRRFGDETVNIEVREGSADHWHIALDHGYDGKGTRRKPEVLEVYQGGLAGARGRVLNYLRSAAIADGKPVVGQPQNFVEFDVPGDGKFKVLNFKDRLQEFRRKVETSLGFKNAKRPDTPHTNNAGQPTGVETGSGSTKTAIENMIDDGDYQAAVDFAAAKKVDIREVLKDQKARLAKIAGLTPTEAAAEPAPAAPAPEAEQPTPAQEPEPTPEPAASVEPPKEGIQDLGEKIGGARKDMEAPSERKAEPMPHVVGIPADVAQRAYEHTSHVPEDRGRQAQARFTNELQDAWDQAMRVARGDEAAVARVREVFDDLVDGYRRRVIDYLGSHSRVASAMIVGPARFPAERMRKRSEAADRKAQEADEYLKRGIKRMQKAARGPIDNSPEAELERVRYNLARREELQEQMKAANVALRKGDDDALSDLGFSEGVIAQLKKGDFAGRKGFPDYKLSNNNAEIRRLRGALKEAEARAAAAQAGPQETERAGVRIVEDAQDDRLRLIFDGKPSEEVREDLKANGFKWSPRNEAWQRQLTGNARAAAKRILDKHFPTKTDDAGNVVMFQRTASQPFYSALERAIADAKLGVMPAAQWKAFLRGLTQKGVKPDELEWTGLTDWIDTQQGKITKQQVLDFLNANGVKVTETVLAGPEAMTPEMQRDIVRRDDITNRLHRLGYDTDYNQDGSLNFVFHRREGGAFAADESVPDRPGDWSDWKDLPDEVRDLTRELRELAPRTARYGDENQRDETQYSSYTLPGGSNYREVLLTLPGKSASSSLLQAREELRAAMVAESEIRARGTFMSPDLTRAVERVQAARAAEIRAERESNGAEYRSPHWEQKNVLAHVRLDDRTDSEGKRVLFVEEIQSDWAQQGKKRGFKPTEAEAQRIKDEYDAAHAARLNSTPGERDAAQERLSRATDEYNARINDAKIPLAPFVGKTDAWVSLALKRIIKMAVDEGYDKVAFVTGEQSADRYSLRKQVRSIEWSPFTVAGGNMPGGTHVIIDTPSGLARFNVDGNGVIESAPNPGILRGEQIEGKRLDDVVGKAAAEKIMGTYRGKLEGEGLNIGGEGMVAFYNRIVPTVLKDVLRKVGGGEIGKVEFGDMTERTREPYIVDDGPGFFVEGGGPRLGPFAVKEQAQIALDELLAKRQRMTQPGFTITTAMREKAAGGLPLFKRDETPAAAAKRGRAQQLADHLSDVWANAPRVVVVDSMADPRVPPSVSALDEQQRAGGAQGSPASFVADGKVYLVADKLNGDRDVLTALFHEVLGHHGLRHAFPGGELRTILDRIAQLNPGLVRERAIAYGLGRWVDDGDGKRFQYGRFDKEGRFLGGEQVARQTAAEELLARMAQTRPQLGWVRRALAAIRTWLRKHVPGFGAMKFSDDELIRSFILPARAWVERGAGVQQSAGVPAFARTDTDAFKHWFGDSKVVDKDGKPLVVYHGTKNAPAEFSKSRVGSASTFLGSYEVERHGIFAAESPELADEYANQGEEPGRAAAQTLMPLYMSIKAPLDTVDGKYTDAIWNAIETAAEELGAKDGYRTARFIGDLWSRHELWKLFDADEGFDPAWNIELLQKAGFDGMRILERSEGDVQNTAAWVAFDPSQVKSATGNRGTFDPNNPDVRFSRVSDAIDTLKSATTEKGLRDILSDHLTSDKTFNWWHNTIGTQYQKAKADPQHFGPVYEAAQDYLHDTSAFANDAAALAPDVVPQLKGWRDAFKPLRLSDADEKALASAIFTGTLQDQKVYTPDELRAQFNATDRQIGLYQQMRAAIDRSLDTLVATDVARYLGQDIPRAIKNMISDGDTGRFKGLVTALAQQEKDKADAALTEVRKANRKRLSDMHRAHKKRREAAKGPMARSNLEDALATERAEVVAETKARADAAKATYDKWNEFERTIKAKYERVDQLKQEGYAPLMRFGRYTVDVVSDEGERQFFGLYESEADAKKAAREFRESGEFKGSTITTGLLSQEAYKQFSSMAPETIELFAEVAGVEQTPLFQEYLRRAKSNRAAIKRLIQRKGIAGFSEDAQRVLAAFLTSNARAASTNLHMGDMGRLIEAIPKEKGDVKDEAIRLKEYVQNPTEEAQRLRGLLFVQYLGGSIASALVNMTQPLTMTLPYLSQFGGLGKAGARLAEAMKSAMHKQTGALGAALAKAEKEGIVSPQEVHQLHAEASRSLGSNPTWRRVLFAWGSMFSLAEQFNRRVSFIAAWNTAKANGNPNPYQFAVDAVEQTQGVYNRGNRPNWARGPVGATVFTFKQFSISYLEFLKRLPPKERAIALAVLVLAAGAQGLPFADDLDDLIDTIGQHLGYDTNAKLWKTKVLTKAFGEMGADFALHGFSALPGFPLDVSWRLAVSNLIPGTGILRKNTSDKSSDVFEAIGPAGGVVRDATRGDVWPLAIRNLRKSIEMYQTGEYRDTRDRKVMDVTGLDALVKGIGFQPAEVARESRGIQMRNQQVQLARNVEAEIASLWAQGIADKEPDKVREARQRLADWNRDNPQSRIGITTGQLERRVLEMRKTRQQRFEKAMPKEMRGTV